MHELSIVQSVVSGVTEHLERNPVGRVLAVRLRVGALSGVVEDSLQFGWDIATQDTMLAGARLEVIHVPATIFCFECGRVVEIDGIHSLRCPACGALSADLRQGRELEIDSLEVEDDDTP